jgi:hypothetical protein
MINFLQKLAIVSAKNVNFFGETVLKIIASVPDVVLKDQRPVLKNSFKI